MNCVFPLFNGPLMSDTNKRMMNDDDDNDDDDDKEDFCQQHC